MKVTYCSPFLPMLLLATACDGSGDGAGDVDVAEGTAPLSIVGKGFDPPPDTLDPDAHVVNVRNLSASSESCKSIGLSWQRPSSWDIDCGKIQSYRAYRNGVFLEELSAGDANCPTATFQLLGNHYQRENYVDEGSTHDYEVRIVDQSGVERSTDVWARHSPPLCATAPLSFRTNVTLVTFSDVVQANCPSYPCIADDPEGVPFSRAQVERDVLSTDGSPNAQAPFAWRVKKHAPDKNIDVQGLVTQWIVLGERSQYCPSPFEGPQCQGVRFQIAADARAFRGDFKHPPRHDVYLLHGVGGGASAGGYIVMAYQGLTQFPVGSLLHEAGHVGFFEDISLPLVDHSRGLRCPGGALPVGPSLRDLSQDAQGVSGRCKAFSYADLTCTMGSGSMFSGYARWHYGFIDATQVTTVPLEHNAELTLEHMDQASTLGSSGSKLAIVGLERNPNDAAYVLEYRDGSTLDYPGNASDANALPEGVYIHLKLRNTGDLGAGYPLSSIPATPYGDTLTLMLSKAQPGVPINSDPGYASSQWRPIYLDPLSSSYCDPYRQVRITLREFTQVGGVDSARVDVERRVDCP